MPHYGMYCNNFRMNERNDNGKHKIVQNTVCLFVVMMTN
jgi:hypothetical protein